MRPGISKKKDFRWPLLGDTSVDNLNETRADSTRLVMRPRDVNAPVRPK